MHTNHSILRYMMAKKVVKQQMIRWMLLFQEFYFVVKDRKGTKNHVFDILCRLDENICSSLVIRLKLNNVFSNEQVLASSYDIIPWFADC